MARPFIAAYWSWSGILQSLRGERYYDIVVMVILGGMGRTAGVIVAAIVLTLLPEFLRGFAEYRMIRYALLTIGLMMLRPQGLFAFRRQRT